MAEPKGNVLTYDELVQIMRVNDYLNIQNLLDLCTTIKGQSGGSITEGAELFPSYYITDTFTQFTSSLIPDTTPALLPTIDETLGGVGVGKSLFIHNDTDVQMILVTTSGENIDEGLYIGAQPDTIWLNAGQKVCLYAFNNTLWKVVGGTEIQRLCEADVCYKSDTLIEVQEGGLITCPDGLVTHIVDFQARLKQNDILKRVQPIGYTSGSGQFGFHYSIIELSTLGVNISQGSIYTEPYALLPGGTRLIDIPNTNRDANGWYDWIPSQPFTNFNIYSDLMYPQVQGHNGVIGLFIANPDDVVFIVGLDVEIFRRYTW